MPLSLFCGFAAKGALLWDAGEIGVLPSFVPVLWGLGAFLELFFIPYAG